MIRLIRQRTLLISIAALLVAYGGLSYTTMPRQEDPSMAERFGLVQVVYPGVAPEQIRQLVVLPLERELSTVSEIREIRTTIRSEAAILQVTLEDALSEEVELNEAWNRVREALARTAQELPDNIIGPTLNRDVLDQASVVLAINGNATLLEIYDVTQDLKEHLQKLPEVDRVQQLANPKRQIKIALNERKLEQSGADYSQLVGALVASNRSLPAGSFRAGEKRLNVSTNSTFRSMDEIRNFPIVLQSGKVVLLKDLGEVRKSPENPLMERMYFNGEPALGLSVVFRKSINLPDAGERLRAHIERFRDSHPALKPKGIQINEVSFQPDYVSKRITSLSWNLLGSMIAVAAVLILGMGPRVGVLVTVMVPTIIVASIGVFGILGGVLNQMSIAALVMSLGILIDNVIVVVEYIQERMDANAGAMEAAAEAMQRLAFPLAAATATTVASFLPMLGSVGPTADFTRDIPTVAILTLIVSYAFAVLIAPPVASLVLKGRAIHLTGSSESLRRIGAWIGQTAHDHRWKVFATASIFLLVATAGFLLIPKKFFPSADRDQLLVTIALPEGSDISITDEAARSLESRIRTLPEVQRTTTFVGSAAPRFYYNLNESPNSPHLAQIMVDVESFEQTAPVIESIESLISQTLPTRLVYVRPMEQGPPVRAAVELQLLGEDPEELAHWTEKAMHLLGRYAGTRDVRSDLGLGVAGIRYVAGDGNAAQYGMDRNVVSSILLARTRGLPVGEFQYEDESIPILLQTGDSERINVQELNSSFVRKTMGPSLRISDLGMPAPEWQPALIQHLNRQRFVSVLSELRGAESGAITQRLISDLNAAGIPESIQLLAAGESGESAEANRAILTALPAGIGLFLVALLMEFRSFRKIGIILVVLPVALMGIVPGLVLSGQPFGFMALLGMLALIGVSVNNGILILDAMERALEQGSDFRQAASQAVAQRLRPVLLTTVTTIVGLLPLGFTSASLWPPFAWSIIAGMAISAAFSLFMVPALYRKKLEAAE